eukprot:2192321-Rhodomonas_salina.1
MPDINMFQLHWDEPTRRLGAGHLHPYLPRVRDSAKARSRVNLRQECDCFCLIRCRVPGTASSNASNRDLYNARLEPVFRNHTQAPTFSAPFAPGLQLISQCFLRSGVWSPPSACDACRDLGEVLPISYAMSGTDLAMPPIALCLSPYALATQCPVLRWRNVGCLSPCTMSCTAIAYGCVMSGTEIAHAYAMYGTAIARAYAMSGTEIAYGQDEIQCKTVLHTGVSPLSLRRCYALSVTEIPYAQRGAERLGSTLA